MISILLPTYNGERYITSSINSILNQSFKDFELLIGFNGTNDNTKNIVKNHTDSRIRIFDYGMDKGKSKTLNKLLTEAKYDFIALQDDDDIWVIDKLEKQIPYFKKGFDVIGSFINYIDEQNNVIGKPSLSTTNDDIVRLSVSGNNQIANTSAIFRKKDAIEIKGWKDGLDGIEDYDFWLRLIRSGKYFINIPEYLVHHRLHSQSNFNTKTHDLSKIL